MSDINPIKQAPVQGMTGLSGGPASLLLTPPIPIVPVYVDEVFATDTWFGNYDVSLICCPFWETGVLNLFAY